MREKVSMPFRFSTLYVLLSVLVLAVATPGWGWAAQKSAPSQEAEIQLSFAPLVKKTAPAVVNIYTRKTVRARARLPLFNDPFFRQFFGEGFGLGRGGPEVQRQQNSLGSGVIVQSDGIIVTNNHVIEGADEVRVVLNDRREFDAEIVATDEKTDLAILRIETNGKILPVIALADSDELEVGDIVLAIGNPFGVGQTVTSGIVSALSRSGVGLSKLGSFIQTDAAINPGNSGGALIDVKGRLIGINTAIFSKSGGSQGIGFAVPSNMVRAVVRGISETGRLVRPWLGASGQAVNQEIADSMGMERPTGVLINAVHKLGSAYQAGIRVGDVVLMVNGREVVDAMSLAHRIATYAVGDTIRLRIKRRKQINKLVLTLTAAPEIPKRDETDLRGEHPLRGAKVINLSPALAEELGIDAFKEGVLILSIVRGTAANRLGFRRGDIVRGINRTATPTVRDLVDLLEKPAEQWRVKVERAGKTQDIVINR